ncbi:FMN-binding protein [Dehalobacter sp. DCM]|uniref:FMN-binding protein n=1 Tax=Dehalobacter sp. DCM TaxID=2907827 RepID=UPI0030817A7D|nr:FMN-binding protein [Dehalobacter sp. DCM]
MKIKKRYIILLIVIVLIVTAFFSVRNMLISSEQNLNYLMQEKIANVDLDNIPDGAYTGTYAASPIEAAVRVTVKDHAITAIEITKHENGRGEPAEAITNTVIETQNLDVDVISGATYSSKVILKAIENALNNAQ